MRTQHFSDQLILNFQSFCLGIFVLASAGFAQPVTPRERISTQLNPDEVIARAGDLTVSAGDYLDAVRDYFSDRDRASAYKDEYERQTAESIVNSIVNQRVQIRVMHELGYDQQPTYQSELKLFQWRHLGELAVQSLPPFTEKDLTEADLREAYGNYTVKPVDKGISFRFIFFRTLGLDEQAVAAKRALAGKTLERVKDGGPFFEVMKEVSEVAEPQENPYWVDENTKGFDPKIYQVLNGMEPGAVSPIVEAKAGMFILWRFPRSERNDIKPFDEMMADPTGHKVVVREALRAKEMGKKNSLLDQIKDRYQAGAIETTDMATLGKLGDETPILKVGDELLVLGDLKLALNRKLDKCSIEEINSKVDALSKQMVFAQYAREKGLRDRLEESASYRKELTRLLEEYLVSASRHEVPDMSEETMQAFYDSHREAFRERCRANARQIHVKPVKGDSGRKEVLALVVRDEAQRLKDLIEKGQTFDQVAGDYHGDRFEINLTRWDDQAPGKIVFGDGKYGSTMLDTFGTVLGPERVRDGFVIYSLVEQLPGKIIPFETAKAQINQLNKKQKAAEKIDAAFQSQLKDLQLTEDLLFIPADLKPRQRK